MARKKHDFLPDKPKAGIWNQLYLTKKQRLSLLKWLLYTLVLVGASVLQDVVLCRLRIFGATTDLVPCVVFLVCILEGAEDGCVFCLLGAMFCLFSGGAPGYYAIPLITAAGVCASILRQNFLRKGFSAAILCAGLAVLIYELTVFVLCVVRDRVAFVGIWKFLLTTVLTVLVSPALYPLLLSIGKIGGEIWKE